MSMYCDQCEQTAHTTACVGDKGVCGKTEDQESLMKIIIYGLKGMAAYKHHARRLGKTDSEIEAFIEEALFATITNVNFDVDALVGLALETGRINLKTMELLNDAHLEKLGQASPVEISEGIQEGPGILVTGHDMADLLNLLEQSAGKGVNIYTHGEMITALSYPKLRAFPHFKGHYGDAWQKQRTEFEAFGGPIVATTNCIMPIKSGTTYIDRFYSTRVTGMTGGTYIKNDDYSAVIAQAQKIGPLKTTAIKKSTIGFHYNAILGIADKIVAAVKSGKIKHFFLIGGCDGAEPGRNYFADYAQNSSKDTVVLTLGCGKYRIRNYDYGTIDLGDGVVIPRLLDMGQCNDSYGAIMVAVALSKAFGCSVNELPLTIVLSWFEQKAVAVLLTLLHLGVKNIKLGPKLPAFVSPNVLDILVKNFQLGPTGENGKKDVFGVLGIECGCDCSH